MPWLGSELFEGFWWDYDPDDGEVQKSVFGNFLFVGYVSRGLDDVSEAVEEYLDYATRPGFIPPASFRFYCHLRDGRDVFYDPGDGEYGVVEDGQVIKKGYNEDLENAWVGKAKGYIASLLGPEHHGGSVPLHGYRHTFVLGNGRHVFYDPGDGEWGIVNDNGWRVHCDYNYNRLFNVTAYDAVGIVADLLEAYEVNTDTSSTETSSEEDTSEYDDESTDDDDRHPDDYLLFTTVNFHGDRMALCYGLSLYWLRERLRTTYTLHQSMPDYDEAINLQEACNSIRGPTTRKFWPPIQADGLDHCYWTRQGQGAVDIALDLMCEVRAAYLVMFRPMNGSLVHCVGVWRGEDETGFFDPNAGVYKVPSDKALRKVFWANLIAWKKIFRQINRLKFYIVKIWDLEDSDDTEST